MTRRSVVAGAAALPVAYSLAACGGGSGGNAGSPTADDRRPTPECVEGPDQATPEQTEGPYCTPNSPERTSLVEDGVRDDRLLVAGRVLSTDCRPIGRALLDFWQADGDGEYDLDGFRL